MNNIYNKSSDGKSFENTSSNESRQFDIEKRFIESLVEELNQILNIGYNDRRIVSSLLTNILNDKLNYRYNSEGLLQQYGDYILDETIKRFYTDLDIPKDIKVNHSHGNHAKFADLVKYIKTNFTPNKKEEDE